jgi:membrane associated rhomboid family serine protease
MSLRRRKPIFTGLLVFGILASWVTVSVCLRQPLYESQHSSLLLSFGALDGKTLQGLELWRLLTSQFLHVHLLHMLFNAGCVFVLGSAIESVLGARWLVSVFLLGGAVGQMFSAMLAPTLISSGASQAVMALCGFVLIASFRIPFGTTSSVFAAAVLAVQVFLDLYVAGVFKFGHFFSLLAGLALGAALLFSAKPKTVSCHR